MSGVLVDARRSAQVYLEESAVLAGGSAGKKLLEIAALYRELCDGILAVVPYNRLSEQFAFNAGPEESWDRDTRVRLAAALREAVSIERSVQTRRQGRFTRARMLVIRGAAAPATADPMFEKAVRATPVPVAALPRKHGGRNVLKAGLARPPILRIF